jgi:hypothetical protein
MADGVNDIEVFTGAVGEGAAIELFGFLDMYKNLPSLDAIILDPESTIVPENPGALFAVSGGLARKATVNNLSQITKYTHRMPKEFDVVCLRDAVRLNKGITSCAAFSAWSVKNSEVLL